MSELPGGSSVRRSSYGPGSGNTPRRPSYASVVTGSGGNNATTRVSALSQHIASIEGNSRPPQYQPETRKPGPEDSSHTHKRGLSHSSLHRRTGSASSYTGQALAPFWCPTYLRNSRYAHKLEAAYNSGRAKVLSDMMSNINSSRDDRIVPGHRGMAYDIVESKPPEDEITPLPSRLNPHDRHPGLELLNDGLDLRYSGPGGKDLEAATVRADHPMPPQCGIYYYEVTIRQKHKDCVVAVGFAAKRFSLERLPGWENHSWAYHGDDGRAFNGSSNGQLYKSPFGVNNTIGCGVDFNKNQVFFTRDGIDLGVAFRDFFPTEDPIYPAIGVKKFSPALISVNFGQQEFQYDIRNRIAAAERDVRRQIAKTSTESLHPGQTATGFTQELVAQYLTHSGYIETARAFAAQVQSERKTLYGEASVLPDLQDPETSDARPRQQIRLAIERGDVDSALAQLESTFEQVPARVPYISFRLKCCKFLELVKKATKNNERKRSPSRRKRSSNGTHTLPVPEDESMDIDPADDSTAINGGNNNNGNGNGKSPATNNSGESAIADPEQEALDTSALEYGRHLMEEYRDASPEYTKALYEINSLMAYWTPSASPHGDLLDSTARMKMAEDVNSAILESLGRSPTAALETAVLQTEALVEVLAQDGGPATLVRLQYRDGGE